MVGANSIWSWLKKWGLWILLGLAVALWIFVKLLPSNKKPEIFAKAKEETGKLKDQMVEAVKEHDAKMKANQDELARIKAIQDEKARLEALAKFANNRK